MSERESESGKKESVVRSIVRTSGLTPKLVARTVRYPVEMEEEIERIITANPQLKKSTLLRHCLSLGFSITVEKLGSD